MDTVSQRRRVVFSGQVQGVGFRYTAQRIARRWMATGFVRNLPNGTVELVVEGNGKVLDQLLADLARQMEGYIQNAETEAAPATGEFADFDIRY